MCQCKNVDIASYKNQVEVSIPSNIIIKYNSPTEDTRKTVCIDKCLINEIQSLWSLGIITTGCCCGHNKQLGYIGVKDNHIEKMKELGYKVRHNECRPKDEDSFVPQYTQRRSLNPKLI